jgi:CRISP-associated protein Cas1
MRDGAFLETCVRDVKTLLRADEAEASEDDLAEVVADADVVMLWDANGRTVAAGRSYDDGELADPFVDEAP